MSQQSRNRIIGAGPDSDPGIWRRWMRAWDVMFYSALLLGLIVGVPGNFRGVDDGPLIIVLAAASAVWYGYFGGVRQLWARSNLFAAAFLTVEATLWLLLIFLNPIFIFSGFGMLAHVCRLGYRWAYAVAAVFGGGMILQEVAEQGPIAWSVVVSASLTAGLFVILSRLVDDISRRSTQQQRLIAELHATRGELAAAERAAGTLAERHRLARDIHDTLAQGFTSIVMLLEAAEAELGNDSKVGEHIDKARKTARDSLTEARSLVWALRPDRLLGGSLDGALESLVDDFRSEGSVDAEFVLVGEARLMPPASEECLLRVAQEALANVRRHAAASRVIATLSYLDDAVALDVRDDGVGFEAASQASTTLFTGGVGLQTMLERAEELGGFRRIESGRGEGTAVVVQLPLPSSTGRESPTVTEAS